MTPGPVSSASGYANARQRTTSSAGQHPYTHQRAPSVPPVPTQQPFVISSARRGKGKDVVDDRDDGEPEVQQLPSRPIAPGMGGRISSLKARISATQGMGSRTSSNRSALVEDDAPPPPQTPVDDDGHEDEVPVIPSRDKGKGKAVEVDPPVETFALKREHKNMMFGSVLDRFAMQIRADLEISA